MSACSTTSEASTSTSISSAANPNKVDNRSYESDRRHTHTWQGIHRQFILGCRVRDLKAVKSSAIGCYSKDELTGVGDSRRGRRDTSISDLRLVGTRFRLDERGDSGNSNGLFGDTPFVVLREIGRSSVDDRALTRSFFLGVVLFFRPQQRVRFKDDVKNRTAYEAVRWAKLPPRLSNPQWSPHYDP